MSKTRLLNRRMRVNISRTAAFSTKKYVIAFKSINCCPAPVLGHHPLVVYNMSSRCHLISSVPRISRDVLWRKNREIVTTLAPFGRNVTTFKHLRQRQKINYLLLTFTVQTTTTLRAFDNN